MMLFIQTFRAYWQSGAAWFMENIEDREHRKRNNCILVTDRTIQCKKWKVWNKILFIIIWEKIYWAIAVNKMYKMCDFCFHCHDKSLGWPEQGVGDRRLGGRGHRGEKVTVMERVLGIPNFSDAVLIWQSLWVCPGWHHLIKKFLMLSAISLLFKFWGLLTSEDIIINFKICFLCSCKHQVHAPQTV